MSSINVYAISKLMETSSTISSCIYMVTYSTDLNELRLTLKVLVVTIDVQWEGKGDVGSARYEPALLPPCPTIRVLSYSN